ncbi:MAG: ADP-ribosylglycohydrolase family protein [Armatimonadetes bacterium]|nr:ADP-ribosylglycohydrolase family protein [Armatimonadota bacterium]
MKAPLSAATPSAVAGSLLGTAAGDALGLPVEGLSRERQQRRFPGLDRHRFFLGRGMVSDDTEHACMTAQALIASAGDPHVFLASLARQLRWWLAALPAGVGYATLRAGLKLWLGFSPDRSGVRSAGNGPAMRAPLLGVCCGHDLERLRALVRASTRLTHTDPRAEHGALAAALAAHLSAASPGAAVAPESFRARLEEALVREPAGELLSLVAKAAASAAAGQSTASFAAEMGWEHGISGYVYQTVPAALHAWMAHPGDFRSAVLAVIHCGGDTDTAAAITGGIVGAGVGKAGIPGEWLSGLREWPRSVAWMERVAARLAEVCADGEPRPPIPLGAGGVLARNLVFLVLVLGHGFRRLLP